METNEWTSLYTCRQPHYINAILSASAFWIRTIKKRLNLQLKSCSKCSLPYTCQVCSSTCSNSTISIVNVGFPRLYRNTRSPLASRAQRVEAIPWYWSRDVLPPPGREWRQRQMSSLAREATWLHPSKRIRASLSSFSAFWPSVACWNIEL